MLSLPAASYLSRVPNMISTHRSNGTGDFPFDLIVSYPVSAADSFVLLGELEKYTTLSSQRFTHVKVTQGGIDIELSGQTESKSL